MSKIAQQFKQGPAFVAYLTAGDGGIQRTEQAALALIKGGVNILEIGVPFSDPVADGPTIQQAHTRALQNHTTLQDTLSLVKSLRQQTDVPIILFSYYNPIFQALKNDFFVKAKQAGVDGCLIVDLPVEESADYFAACKENNIDPVLLLAPSTPVERIEKINSHGSGMLYYACRKGITGVQQALPADFANKMKLIKQHTNLPVVAGFGIADAAIAKKVLQVADGFVVGSRFVKAVAQGLMLDELTALAKSIDPN